MAFTRPAQELTDFLTHNPWTPLYPNVILGGGLKLAIWAAIPLLAVCPGNLRTRDDANPTGHWHGGHQGSGTRFA